MLGMLTLFAFSLGNKLYGLEVARTMAFLSLGLLELVHSLNIKSDESIFKTGLFENKYLIGALILGTILQVVVVCIPTLADIFKLVPLNRVQWLYVALISISPIAIIELQKKFNEIKFGKVVYGYKERYEEWHNLCTSHFFYTKLFKSSSFISSNPSTATRLSFNNLPISSLLSNLL